MFKIGPANYALSRRVQTFDAFISRDWRASHHAKFLCLTIIHNSPAAAIASFLASCLLGVFVLCEVMDDDLALLLTPLCVVTFYIVLFSWQWIRCLIRRPVMLFLDKFCIVQHIEELKMKGILGLGVFLLQSKNLLVLWSPQYFSRLWCTYELVTFLKDQPWHDAVTFMPVKMSYLLLLFSAFWHLTVFTYYLLQEWLDILIGNDEADGMFLTYLLVLVVGLVCIVIPFVNYLGIELMSDLEILPEQLSSFRIQDASCFCCSNEHIHPVSGRSLPCDRQLVHETLHSWRSQADGHTEAGPALAEDPEETLEFFNALVQTRLSEVVLQSMRGTFPVKYVLYMTCVCTFPFIAVYISRGIMKMLEGPDLEDGEEEEAEEVMVAPRRMLRGFCQATYPVLVILFAARGFQPLLKLGLSMQKLVPRAAASFLLAPATLFVTILTWFPFEYTMLRTDEQEESLLWLFPYLVMLLVTVCAYCHGPFLAKPKTLQVGKAKCEPGREKEEDEESTVSL
ncbi:unnamed protein product [Symbiodinium sp. CCMP2592]|nr:unnamed protein product [Symbiodinium sp. CCMP2592]